MLDLSKGSVEKWRARLPSDVASVVPAAEDLDAATEAAVKSVSEAGSGAAVIDALVAEPPLADAMGRARRMRLMAWIAAAEPGRSRQSALRKLADGCRPFDEDARAMASACAHRAAALTFREANVFAVRDAALDADAKLERRAGREQAASPEGPKGAPAQAGEGPKETRTGGGSQ